MSDAAAGSRLGTVLPAQVILIYHMVREPKYILEPENRGMFGRRRRARILRENEAREAEARFERSKRAGRAIYARIAELKNLPRENLPDAVFLLFMEAKQQSELIRRSIRDRTRYDFSFGGMIDGDLAACLAEGAACALRDHVTSPQTLFEAISEQLPDVHFTIHEQDAVSMVAAMIREQRLEGILEGLRLAGLLNNTPDRRHAVSETGRQ
ncbi:hypothetical protein [Bradyrhizobium sp. LMG 9283]|uniref:hypothetical protein n=1 Tax=Bradyrhizobium sp. LMG 9283 TaxID=592064 RepID=UPI0038904108